MECPADSRIARSLATLPKGGAAAPLHWGFDCACCITIRFAGSRVVRGARRREWRRSGDWAFPDGAQPRGAFSCLRQLYGGAAALLTASPRLYGSSSGFEMAQNRRYLPIWGLRWNERASYGMNAARLAALRAEKGQYRRYCANQEVAGTHWRARLQTRGDRRALVDSAKREVAGARRQIACQTKGRRRAPTALVAFYGGANSRPSRPPSAKAAGAPAPTAAGRRPCR